MLYQTGISFQNFKSFKEKVKFNFAPLTILTGANSSGKSTVYQALSFFNTFLDETVKKYINDFNSFENDKLLTVLFKEVNSNKFINQNKIFKNLLNNVSDSNCLYFEIPLSFHSYSNNIIGKFYFELRTKITDVCQLTKFIVFDDVLQKSLIEYELVDKQVKMKTDFKIFYNDILHRANAYKLLVTYLMQKVNDFGLDKIEQLHSELLVNINNDNKFKKLSTALFGEENDVTNFYKIPNKDTYKNNDNFESSYDVIVEFNEKNTFLFQFDGSLFGLLRFFENQKKYINKSLNVLDEFISLDSFRILKDECYINSDDINATNQHILEKLNLVEFRYTLADKNNSNKYLYKQVNDAVVKDILKLEPNNYLSSYEDKTTSFFNDFINNFIFRYSASSLIGFNIEVIELNRNVNIEKYFDLRDSKYDFIYNYFKTSQNSNFINSCLQRFGIGDILDVKIIDNSFMSLIIDNERSVADEGQGIKNLIFLMFKLFSYVEKMSFIYKTKLIYIEEPETGLHPEYQSILAEFLISISKKYNLQFVIETHSEYFIRKLQVLIATDVLKQSDVNIYYFNKSSNKTAAEKCYEITIDEFGTLSRNFGSGFFDESSNLNVLLYAINRDNYN
jgi:predicted ATPase